MSGMIEKVARAICVANGEDPDKPSGAYGVWWKASIEEAFAAIEAMRTPSAEMLAAAFPIEKEEEFSHEDKCLGAAACLQLGGGADIGLLEGEAVKQAAFLARDYRLMIEAALSEKI